LRIEGVMEEIRYLLFFLDRRINLEKNREYTIGREPGNEIILPHRSVSRAHAVISWKDKGFVIRDRASTNGTFVGSLRVTEEGLGDRSRIQIGVYALEFRATDPRLPGSAIDDRTPADTMLLEEGFARLVKNAKDPSLVSQIMDIKHLIVKKDRNLRNLVYKDSLTGLANRRYFDKMLVAEFERASRYERQLCLLMIDIDNFKKVNDTFGHQKGDAVLEAVARLVLTVTRQNDIVARYGGEEICVIIPETSGEGGRKVAEKIRNTVLFYSKQRAGIGVTVSIGVSAKSSVNDSKTKLLEAADRELYKAKQNGRNRVYADVTL
jgi:diguanylate cyclase (GGDEF)-like protein